MHNSFNQRFSEIRHGPGLLNRANECEAAIKGGKKADGSDQFWSTDDVQIN